jgi:hypothetical protein
VGVQLQSRRSIEAQLDQQERWVSDVAHELRTPLTALLLVGDSLSAQVTSGNAVLVERLQRELRRALQAPGQAAGSPRERGPRRRSQSWSQNPTWCLVPLPRVQLRPGRRAASCLARQAAPLAGQVALLAGRVALARGTAS